MISPITLKFKELLTELDAIEAVANSDSDWELKHQIIFHHHTHMIRPLLQHLGIKFDWADPDTGYADDVLAYINAISRLRTITTSYFAALRGAPAAK